MIIIKTKVVLMASKDILQAQLKRAQFERGCLYDLREEYKNDPERDELIQADLVKTSKAIGLLIQLIDEQTKAIEELAK